MGKSGRQKAKIHAGKGSQLYFLVDHEELKRGQRQVPKEQHKLCVSRYSETQQGPGCQARFCACRLPFETILTIGRYRQKKKKKRKKEKKRKFVPE